MHDCLKGKALGFHQSLDELELGKNALNKGAYCFPRQELSLTDFHWCQLLFYEVQRCFGEVGLQANP